MLPAALMSEKNVLVIWFWLFNEHNILTHILDRVNNIYLNSRVELVDNQHPSGLKSALSIVGGGSIASTLQVWFRIIKCLSVSVGGVRKVSYAEIRILTFLGKNECAFRQRYVHFIYLHEHHLTGLHQCSK